MIAMEVWHEIVRSTLSDETLERFDEQTLWHAAEHAWQHDEGYVAFRIGLELGFRRARSTLSRRLRRV